MGWYDKQFASLLTKKEFENELLKKATFTFIIILVFSYWLCLLLGFPMMPNISV